MEIKWLGHSCFQLKGKQATVITDPFSPEVGYSLDSPTAQIVTVSHPHPGHSYAQGISEVKKVIQGPGEYEVSGTLILGIATYHDNEKGAVRGKNTAYIIELDDLMVCHLGDLGHVLTTRQVEELDNVDILLLPVGGKSTIDAPMAAEVMRQLEPKIVIPMHYSTPALKRELDPVERFLKEISAGQLTPQPQLSITRSKLPDNTQVVLLDYQH